MTGHIARFRALGTNATVLTTRSGALDAALEAARAQIDGIDAACSRFRDDSELVALNAAAGSAVTVSPLLFDAITTALRAAAVTQGCVDPTVGTSVRALGYDRDFRSVPPDGPALEVHLRAAPGWQSVVMDRTAHTVQVPVGVELDLGATAKALAVDLAAESAGRASGAPVLVSIGGDLAVGGPARPDGWPVLVTHDHAVDEDPEGQTVTIEAGGLATSGTAVRHWRRGQVEVHHLVDPRTGRSATSCWRTATVAAACCVDANIATTAAIVLGPDAPAWLEGLGLPARLVGTDGRVLRVGGWPAEVAPAPLRGFGAPASRPEVVVR